MNKKITKEIDKKLRKIKKQLNIEILKESNKNFNAKMDTLSLLFDIENENKLLHKRIDTLYKSIISIYIIDLLILINWVVVLWKI